ncbi:MAG: hypothetical protein NC300_12965 [Bacteroidales bacterium]|nr:hypothetical protein [Bacteroidales bacterium]
MDRLTLKEDKKEMICRYEDCDTCEEYCPDMNKDNCPCLQEVLEKLAGYEDLEEQGKLIELSCKVGTTLYWIPRTENKIIPMKILYYMVFLDGKKMAIQYCGDNDSLYYYSTVVSEKDIGKTVFLTREQAELALKGIKE